MLDAIVVGGGIAGLTCAYRLMRAGLDVQVLEAGSVAGGVMRTVDSEGHRLEHGPNTIQRSSPDLESLIEDLGLAPEVVEAASAANRRYIVRHGRPVAVPSSGMEMVTTDLLSWRAKLRIASEPFRSAKRDDSDESIAAFVRRRMGDEALEYTIDPFVSGVYAGDPDALSVQHAFPKVYRLENEFGSLIKGAVPTLNERRSAPRPRWRMFSFRDGLQSLPRRIANELGSRVRFDFTIQRIGMNRDGWSVTSGGDTYRARSLVFAAPLHTLNQINLPPSVRLPEASRVAYPPLAIIYTGFKRDQVDHPLDGFGMLVPSVEKDFSILGSLFTSSLFSDRAPMGHVSITSFMGGRRKPDLTRIPDAQLVNLATADLSRLLGIQGAPHFSCVYRWEKSIPQYEVGYQTVKDELREAEESNPVLFFAGNYRDGVSVPDTVRQAEQTAARVIQALDGTASR